MVDLILSNAHVVDSHNKTNGLFDISITKGKIDSVKPVSYTHLTLPTKA